MSSVRLTSANLHDPVLPFVKPVLVTLRATQTIGDAHAAVRAAPSARNVLYFYVLDDDDRLAGVVPIRHLLAAPLDERVNQVMIPGVVAIPSWATVLIASEYFATRKLKAFPVIRDDGTLVGAVDNGLFTGEVIDVARETYDDIYQLLGVHATAMGTPWTRTRTAFRGCSRTSPAGCSVPSSPRSSSCCCSRSSCSRCSSRSCWRWPKASACSRPR